MACHEETWKLQGCLQGQGRSPCGPSHSSQHIGRWLAQGAQALACLVLTHNPENLFGTLEGGHRGHQAHLLSIQEVTSGTTWTYSLP